MSKAWVLEILGALVRKLIEWEMKTSLYPDAQSFNQLCALFLKIACDENLKFDLVHMSICYNTDYEWIKPSTSWLMFSKVAWSMPDQMNMFYVCPQAEWRDEVRHHFEKIKSEGTCLHRLDEELIKRRREELR